MSTTLSFLIRDGLPSDIPACLALEHQYETEFVWQMRLYEDGDQRHVVFQTERLPRKMEATFPADEDRIRLALPPEHCFLVIESRDHGELLGYLTMHSNPVQRIAHLQDLVISQPFRRRRVGSRLLQVARQWARNHDLIRLTAELETRNYPGILFCQHAGLAFCGFNDHYFPSRDIAVFFTESLR